jgi:hypothetical protein
MVHQTGRQIEVAYKVESAYGALAGASGAKVFRPNSGNLSMSIEPIGSNENRRDGMKTRGRHGTRNVTGQYTGDLSVGSYDDWIEAVFRGTFSAALELDEGDFTSITTTANTIVLASGSPISLGLRVGDIIRLSDHATAANNDRNLRITALDSTTITVAETITLNNTPDTDVTITRPKKVIQGVTSRSFTVEEREIDIDSSEVFTGIRVGQMQLQMQPNGMATLSFSLVGQDMQVKSGADSPYFTTPSETTTIGLTSVEAKIRIGSEDVVDITSLDLTLNLNAAGQPVVGSNLTPDVFTNLADVQGSITALKRDAARTQQYLDEDGLSLYLLFEEKVESGTPGFCAFCIPNLTLASATKSDLGTDGARTQSFSLLVGKDLRGGAYDPTMLTFQTSAA